MSKVNAFGVIWLAVAIPTVPFAAPTVPHVVNYQGRLTDPTGTPLADGPHTIRLIIWDDSTSTNPTDLKWDSGPLTVTTDKGLFSIQLGAPPQPALTPSLVVDSLRFLGITVGADPEISPRTRLTSVPYAFAAESAASAALAPDYLPLAGGTMTGGTSHNNAIDVWQWSGSNRTIVSPLDASIITYGSDNQEQARLWGTAWGELQLHNDQPANTQTVLLTARGISANGGALWLTDNAGVTRIYLDAGGSSDGAVSLPDSAIDAREILDEPGIVSTQSASGFALTTIMQDLTTATITTPAPGYIVVYGSASISCGGTTGTNFGYIQVDETAAGTANFPNVSVYGLASSITTSANYFSPPTQRVYFKAAGTYTFRLEAAMFAGNSTGAFQNANYPLLTAMYFPTSYGSVSAAIADAGSREMQTARQVNAVDPLSGSTHAATIADLRELEIKAARLRAAAEQAERQLAEAQLRRRQEIQSQSSEMK